MQRMPLEIGMKISGFTLIELLVVLVVISITMTFALMTFGDFGAHRRLLMSAEQLKNQLQLIEHQAILESTSMGVDFNKNHYRVLRQSHASAWQPITNHSVYREHHFPTQAHVEFIGPKQHPSIIINSSGDMTPFTLRLTLPHQQSVVYIKGTADGDIRVESLP